MDVRELKRALKKLSTADTIRTPASVPADNRNAASGRARTREVSSRYRSPSPSAVSGTICSSSPNSTRPSSASTVSTQRRAVSADRNRPSRPSSPPGQSSSTPIKDTAAETLLVSRKSVGHRLPESLWPSTMRSLSVSFQSDSFSLPVSKREKPVSHTHSDRTLRPSSNVVHRQGETPSSRKPTPERNRNPLKGKISTDQSENSRPVDSLHCRLVDQHRWPSRTGGKVSSNALNRSIDFTDKMSKTSSLPRSGMVTPPLRRLSLDGASIPLQKSASDLLTLVSCDENGKATMKGSSVDDTSLRTQKLGFSRSLVRTPSVNPAARSHSLSTGSRPPSPSVSRGVSPSRTKAVNPPPSRGPSPARVRPSSPSRQPQTSTSVLSFIADIKKGKKAANHIEEVHQLRLLYNRHLQWRYANARADFVLHCQKAKAEQKLYRVWRTISDLWDLVIEKRIVLRQLRLKLKLCSILNNQLTCLDEWAFIERDNTNSLSSAIQDLRVSTLHIPFTGGAKGDIETVKAAIYSAVDVMQSIRFSLCSILSRVQGINCLVFELADVAARERALLDECESLLASTAAMQVDEYSLRTHLLQLKQAQRNGVPPMLGNHT
ncbi:AUGMIN subunit 8-like [Olea europaea var. sylvestris]|uniref:AUGMIN subunit 8-like n=1 Tax=Olea europaea var. sylvestris TaxID=158386 RepID=UPI000C1D0A29|nr:AUGMIN subunit 8-like [Olea europaea var. sylvestris]XP_022861598.1 AUGMIN subunit 8-like [Olea europaea var. sylvestris]XP_022861599.1 AUGMIN subunit 8-like [Olea europaea var. sylvestris]XP_022861600.1 AUGMIN subunit 8-like [Olea europaea var. sylvestris]XP_022861602.1 AUGMIN subunit 8-like [Olea europaea var. sylvestris]XP_022861603.1 AUGMIN subunit 8-like [Olea europaea var. sylvestris]